MRNSIVEWVFNFIVLIFATSTIAQPFVIPSGSIEPTLMTGDHLIVGKLAYSPADPLTNPGDRLRMVDKQLYRNDVKLNEPCVQHIFANYIPSRDDVADFVVPPGKYFAMGDNRDNSSDSRVWGYVPRENIIGKPLIIYWSYVANTEDLSDYSAHHAIDLVEHFFSKTRWDRTLKLVRP